MTAQFLALLGSIGSKDVLGFLWVENAVDELFPLMALSREIIVIDSDFISSCAVVAASDNAFVN